MADKKISELTALTGANVATDDQLVIVDTSAALTKNITIDEFKNALDTATGFVRITGDTMTGALDVQSTITADGLTVDGTFNFTSAVNGIINNPASCFINIDSDNNNAGEAFYISRDATNTAGARVAKFDATGDISFYEDTGTTAKFFWDASAETLDIGGGASNAILDVVGSAQNDWALRAENTEGTGQGWGALVVASANTSSEKAFEVRKNTSDTAMLIDGSGNVGIGTSSIAAKLHIESASGSITPSVHADELLVEGSGNSGITIGSGISSQGSIRFADSGGDSRGQVNYDHSADSLRFYTADSLAATIASDGSVGIGTSSPSALLTVGNGLTGTKTIALNGGGSSSSVMNLDFLGGGTGNPSGRIGYSSSTEAMTFHTGDLASIAEAMRIDSSGNTTFKANNSSVGPIVTLENTASAVNGQAWGSIHFKSNDTSTNASGTRASIVGTSTSFNGDGNLVFSTAPSNGSNTERMRIDSSGNVGIGTTADQQASSTNEGIWLAPGVTSSFSANSVPLTINRMGTGGNNRINIDLRNNGTSRAELGTLGASSGMYVAIGGSEAMRIDSSGNLLVGKTASNYNTTGTQLSSNGQVTFTSDGNTTLQINRKTSDGAIQRFSKDGTTVGSIGVESSDLIIDGAANHSGFRFLGASVRPRYNGAGSDAAVDIGNSSQRFKDIYATNGTIQTSDRNEKQDIAELSDAEQRVAVAAKGLLRKFRWKDAVAEKGDEARTHFGIIAQDLQAAFAAEGLDAGDYAMFISSTWTDEETGEERTRMGVRYSELLAFIIAAI